MTAAGVVPELAPTHQPLPVPGDGKRSQGTTGYLQQSPALLVVGEHPFALDEPFVLLARDRRARVADPELGRLLGDGLRLGHTCPSATDLIASTMFT